jgi:phenylpropionate dioxygenase-like ring-hydroxylating dioxygenase large terminal subunit
MLSKENNETLCRVGSGTPMGALLRRYWLPLLLSSELPERDGAPVRIRHLGESLIAFRDTEGQVGLVAENCPHRGASLFFGRNEESGLRCVYHGWKFDSSGACVDMPNEPPESNFKHKVKVTAYTCRERNGIIWAYLGAASDEPPLPEIEWATLPEGQRYISKRVQECNWVQGFEGGIDSSHSVFLHGRLDTVAISGVRRPTQGPGIRAKDKHPRFETVDTEYGVLIAARRNADDDHYYWRITPFVMPCYNIIPPYGESPTVGGLAWVPMDDETTMVWSFTWHPTRDLLDAELEQMRSYPGGGIHVGPEGLLPPTTQPGGRWRTRANGRNDFLVDYDAQRTTHFFGVLNLSLQDQAVQESMGRILDRRREHLGTADSGIIGVRRRLLRAVKENQEGTDAAIGLTPDQQRVRSAAMVLPKSESWVRALREHLTVRQGVDYTAV